MTTFSPVLVAAFLSVGDSRPFPSVLATTPTQNPPPQGPTSSSLVSGSKLEAVLEIIKEVTTIHPEV
jgi:hypothetical protein